MNNKVDPKAFPLQEEMEKIEESPAKSIFDGPPSSDVPQSREEGNIMHGFRSSR